MEIIPIDQIPKEIINTPTTNLLEVYRNCQEMVEICKSLNGIGLAAPQVGIPWRLLVVKNSDNWNFLVDCDYEPIGDEKAISIEGCLSLRKNEQLRAFRVERWVKIRLMGKKITEVDGKPKLANIDYEVQSDTYNVICQHEIDHTRSILISQIGEEIEVTSRSV